MNAQGFFRDEQGSLSSARVLLVCSLVFTALLIVADSIVLDVPDPAYVLLGTICTGLLAWAAGPRIAQYVGPQIGAVASGIAGAGGRRSGTGEGHDTFAASSPPPEELP